MAVKTRLRYPDMKAPMNTLDFRAGLLPKNLKI
jgi:hypothetical protein